MDAARLNEALHLLARVSPAMRRYVAGGAGSDTSESLLVRPDILRISSYVRAQSTHATYLPAPAPPAVVTDKEYFFASLFHDDDGVLTQTTPEAEIERLLRVIAESSLSSSSATTGTRDVPLGGPLRPGAAPDPPRRRRRPPPRRRARGALAFPALGCDLSDECRITPRSAGLFYGGVIGLNIASSAPGASSRLMGRFVSDLISGDMLAIMRQSDDVAVIFSLRNNGLNRKDKYLLACRRAAVDALCGEGVGELAPDAILSERHIVEYRPCPLCHAPPEPGKCQCGEWEGFHDAMLRPSGKRDVFQMRFGGHVQGFIRTTTAVPDGSGVFTLDASVCSLQARADLPADQFPGVSRLVTQFVQKRMSTFVQAPVPARLRHRPVSVDQCRLTPPGDEAAPAQALFGTAASHFGAAPRDASPWTPVGSTLTAETAAPAAASTALAPPHTAPALASSLADAGALKEAEKQRKAYARKLRNRDAALRSNQKRSSDYKKLVSDLEAGRLLLASLRVREAGLRAERAQLSALLPKTERDGSRRAPAADGGPAR